MPKHGPLRSAPDVEPMFYSLRDLVILTGLSQSTLKERVATGEFPAPVRFGARANRWRRADVHAWVDALTTTAEPAKPRGVMAERARKKAEQAQS